MLLTICMLVEPGVMVMAKSESEVQEAETVESEENTETSKAETETDKVDSTAEKKKQESDTAGETEIQPGERTATIMVVSITGNEMTYYEVEDEAETKVASEETEQSETDVDTESEESEISTDTDKNTEAVEKDAQTDDVEPEDTEGMSVQKDSSMTPPGGQQQGEGIPQGDSSMTPPDGMPQKDETMTPPDGMSQGDGTMAPPDGMQQNGSDSEDMPSGDFSKDGRSEQQDTKTVYLPVPVVVHTDTDEKRTFSILEAGDRLQVTIVTDEEGNETITEIWMLNE